MKRLSTLVLMATLLAACAGPATPPSEGFAIYLLAEKLPPAEVARADLGTLKLEGEPILSTEDIVAYISGTHQITLTPSAMERLGQLKVPVSGAGIPFVVCVDKEPIYRGAFWSPLSSLSFDGVAIMLLPGVLPGARLDYVRIEANSVGERPDPRSLASMLTTPFASIRRRRWIFCLRCRPRRRPDLALAARCASGPRRLSSCWNWQCARALRPRSARSLRAPIAPRGRSC